jgi:uncharacterized protein YbjT (DUF2867 family)
MNAIERARRRLKEQPLRWLVTGSAGFIGSHLVSTLLELDQTVVGLDNFATGYPRNIDDVRTSVSAERWSRHRFVEAGHPQSGRVPCRVRGNRRRAAPGRARLGSALARGPGRDERD